MSRILQFVGLQATPEEAFQNTMQQYTQNCTDLNRQINITRFKIDLLIKQRDRIVARLQNPTQSATYAHTLRNIAAEQQMLKVHMSKHATFMSAIDELNQTHSIHQKAQTEKHINHVMDIAHVHMRVKDIETTHKAIETKKTEGQTINKLIGNDQYIKDTQATADVALEQAQIDMALATLTTSLEQPTAATRTTVPGAATLLKF